MRHFSPIGRLGEFLLQEGQLVEVPTWQALEVEGKSQGRTWELEDWSLREEIPATVKELQDLIEPNLPWAENQFKERVSGEPLNPGETYKEWPWYRGNVETHKPQGQFSHTYMERYWPKNAGNARQQSHGNWGLRFKYGDLGDVVNLLAKQPTTRQAYLPVFFPEDTGAVHGERIPCSLGYLFLMRGGKLNITYYIRSCDFYRHFRDDVYMTARLCQWVLSALRDEPETLQQEEDWRDVQPGRLTMHIGSLHIFEGDLPRLGREYGSDS